MFKNMDNDILMRLPWPWGATEHLGSPEAIAEYLTAAMEDGDSDLLLAVLGDIAKGMTQLARDTDLGRESLYKALTPGAKPRFDTVMNDAWNGRTPSRYGLI